MTVNIIDHGNLIEVTLIPQTIAESALLMRLGANAKKDGASVRSYFLGDRIDTNIQFTLKQRKEISIGTKE